MTPNAAAGRGADAAPAEAAIADRLAELDRQLDGADFLCGAFSVADIAAFMAVLFGLRLGGPKLEPWRAVARWYGRLAERPAFAAAVAAIAQADRSLSYPWVKG
ncbi:MAG: glutathione binding-like protein [Alphaproteobacteria bacterium]